MNQTVHQLLQLVLQGLAWFLRTIEALWVWSWAQIASVAKISWGNLPPWKLAFGLIAIVAMAVIIIGLFRRGLHALHRIAAAFWTMAVTAFGVLVVVVIAGLLSRGVTWWSQQCPMISGRSSCKPLHHSRDCRVPYDAALTEISGSALPRQQS